MRATTTRHGTAAATCAAGILMLAAVIGSPPRAAGETPGEWDPFSEDEHRLFRGFFYDSFSLFFEIVGIDEMPAALDEFEQSLESFPPELCPAVVDFALFRSQLVQSLLLDGLSEDLARVLMSRIIFQVGDVPWGPLGEVEPEDQPAALEAKDHVKEYLADAGERLVMVHRHCVENHQRRAGVVSAIRFTTNYAPTPIEFRMRELFESLVPATAWILRKSRESERQDRLADLESLIDSMEQKYDLSVPRFH